MPALKWDGLRIFLAVARAGQMLGAGRVLGQDQATVSRRLKALEAELDAELFHRSPAGVTLTEAGERLLPMAERMESEALQAVSTVGRANLELAGAVRIGAPDGLGSYYLAPILAELATDHPNLSLQLAPLPRTFSIGQREADIAITLERPTEGRLVARKLTDYTLSLYASPGYLGEVGPIDQVEDLSRCLFVTYVQDSLYSPHLAYDQELIPRAGQMFECASVVAQALTLAERGIGYVHDYALPIAPPLVKVLPELRVRLSYWLVYHADARQARRVTEVAETLSARVAADRSLFLPG
ncbi:MAG: LysR family transcriptional regulator [Pseudomonadota bacterium]